MCVLSGVIFALCYFRVAHIYIIGVIAAILFFMERDNDTFKNLRTIPVTSTQMVLAKIIVLFLFGIVFCVASTIATILCGFGTLEVYGIGYKLFLAVETGIFITAGTLPLIVLVVFFSKTYVFSILLCVFYSVLNMSATALFDTLPKTMLWLLPTPLTTFWSAGDMAAHGIKMDLEQMTGLIPSTFQVVFILGIMAFVSFLLIDRLYKQRGEFKNYNKPRDKVSQGGVRQQASIPVVLACCVSPPNSGRRSINL